MTSALDDRQFDWNSKIRNSARVEGLVPAGFESHLRILHKAEVRCEPGVGDGPLIYLGWAAVARALNKELHSDTVWRDLSGVYGEPATVEGLGVCGPPEEGRLDAAGFGALARMLATSTTVPVHAAFWMGWGSIDAGPHTVCDHQQSTTVAIGGLDFRIYCLTPTELAESNWMTTPEFGWPDGYGLTPTYLWPMDFSWFLATDVDMDSSILASSPSLAEDVACLPELESLPVEPSTDLTASGP